MNGDEIYAAQAAAAKDISKFIDLFDAPGVADAAERLAVAAREFGVALVDGGLSATDAARAAVGLTMKALLP